MIWFWTIWFGWWFGWMIPGYFLIKKHEAKSPPEKKFRMLMISGLFIPCYLTVVLWHKGARWCGERLFKETE